MAISRRGHVSHPDGFVDQTKHRICVQAETRPSRSQTSTTCIVEMLSSFLLSQLFSKVQLINTLHSTSWGNDFITGTNLALDDILFASTLNPAMLLEGCDTVLHMSSISDADHAVVVNGGQDNPSHVYKLKKALYGLKQALRAWYIMLSSFLISQHFSKGAVDPTLFTWQAGNDLLPVQIYVDDIIFASTNTAMCNEFANQMTTKFKMSIMGQMSFFLGLQIS
ncbi:retrovirus-related pol polyprotein from transposon TNT 1-94 [Tanacetum coccineum]